MSIEDARARLLSNPFFVLGLEPTATAIEVEREGRKLLAMLELDLREAQTYSTPLGPVDRTSSAVRQAMAVLRDPKRRLPHELWAAGGSKLVIEDAAETHEEYRFAWPDALVLFGWNL